MKEILLTRFFLASFKLKVRREELQEEEDGVMHVEGLIVVKCKKIIRNTDKYSTLEKFHPPFAFVSNLFHNFEEVIRTTETCFE